MGPLKNPLEGGKISGYQLFLVLITTIIATGILFVPAITAIAAGHDGWASVLVVSTIPGLLVAEICIRLERRFPGQTLIQYSETILGKFFGKVIGFLFLFFLVYINAVIIREFATFVVGAFMPETPLIVVTGAFMILAASMVRNGIEVICRMNEFTIMLFFLAFITIVFLVAPEMNFDNLLPVFEKGIKPVILGGLPPSVWRGEVVVIAILLPFLNSPQKARKASFGAVITVGVLLAVVSIATVAVLGEITAHETFPVLALTEYISLAEFLERIEAVIMVIWVSGVMIKVGVFYYVAVLSTAQWFNLKDYKQVALPIGVILTVWSIIVFESGIEMVGFLATTTIPWGLFHELLIPLFLLVAAVITRKKGVKGK